MFLTLGLVINSKTVCLIPCYCKQRNDIHYKVPVYKPIRFTWNNRPTACIWELLYPPTTHTSCDSVLKFYSPNELLSPGARVKCTCASTCYFPIYVCYTNSRWQMVNTLYWKHKYLPYTPGFTVFRIRNIFFRIRILRSVFWLPGSRTPIIFQRLFTNFFKYIIVDTSRFVR
jgi:hypothetical protein